MQPVIPASKRWRQEDKPQVHGSFESRLCYIRPSLNKQINRNKKTKTKTPQKQKEKQSEKNINGTHFFFKIIKSKH